MLRLNTSFLLIFLFAQGIVYSQNFPVQVHVQLTPPYSGYLPDYADEFNDQMKIILTMNDLSAQSYSVRLSIEIEGNGFLIKTNHAIAHPPIVLSAGVPVEITGDDLRFYLVSQNLVFSGIDAYQYEQTKVLPEGMYSVCATIYEYYSPSQQLSNVSCSVAWFSLHDPPLTTLPSCGAGITGSPAPLIQFSWTPMHMNSANSSGNTAYVFEIFEIRPSGTNPNITVNSIAPLFSTQLNQTSFAYGITEPTLITGMEYAWRVKAIDLSGRDLYRNNGYSEVCTFQFGDFTSVLTSGVSLNLQANGSGPRQGTAWWNGTGNYSYQVDVRKTGNSSYQWFTFLSETPSLKINNLEPGTEYECRVRASGGSYLSAWSNTATFTTLSPTGYLCNSLSLPPVQNNAQPLLHASAGMIINAGQFEMILTSVHPDSSPGRYSGYGKIEIPFALMSVNVSFNSIFIDENNTMRQGKAEVITEGIGYWMSQIFNDDNTDYYYPYNIDSLYILDGALVIIADENEITIVFPPGEMMIIQDGDGSFYVLLPDGSLQAINNTAVNLSDLEKNILEQAMMKLISSFPQEYTDSLKNISDARRSQLENGDPLPVTSVLIMHSPGNETNSENNVQIHSELMQTDLELLCALACRRFAHVFIDSGNYSLLTGEVTIGTIPLLDFLRAALEENSDMDMITGTISTSTINFLKNKIKEYSFKF